MLFAAALAARLLEPAPASWAVRIVLAAFAVAVLPGALLLLVACRRREWSALELAALGLPISAGLLQILTILALTLQQPMPVWLWVLGIWNAAALGYLVLRSPADERVAIPGGEIALAGGLILLGSLLYLAGSPVDTPEDAIHISVVQRLAAVAAPRLDNIYFAPGIVYTYPFPGTHFLMAAISRFGDIDPLFLYHKLRVLWGPGAVALVYAAATAVFASRRIGLAAGGAALVFVLAGPFAAVPGFFWGQLAPFSHASDVAMAILLPGLLVLTWHLLGAPTRGEVVFFGLATASLVLMLAIVHTRELVQYLVYLAAFTGFLALTGRWRRALPRAAALTAGAALFGLAYVRWHEGAVVHIGTLVSEQQDRLGLLDAAFSPAALVAPPLPLLDAFVKEYWTLYYGFNAVVLAAAPFVVFAFRRRPLAWFLLAAMLAYALIFRSALLAGLYIHFTYFEILFTPVRNVIFFIHLLAGVAIYLGAVAMGRGGARSAVLLALGAGMAVGLVPRLQIGAWIEAAAPVFWPALITAIVSAMVIGSVVPPRDAARPADADAALGPSPARAIATLVLIALVAGLWAARYGTATSSRVVGIRWQDEVGERERTELAQRFALASGRPRGEGGNNWAYELTDLSPGNIRALVTSPRVYDTLGLDRRQFVPDESAERGPTERWLGGRRDARADQPRLIALSALLLILAGWLARRPQAGPALPLTSDRPGAWAPAFVVLTLTAGAVSWNGDLSPLRTLRATEHSLPSPAALVAAQRCIDERDADLPYQPPGLALRLPHVRSCPPSPSLVAWVAGHVPVDAVFVANKWNDYLPTAFMPQQVVVLGGTRGGLFNGDKLFAAYFRLYRESLLKHGTQPFFNLRETRADREAFVDALGVTHVLVDPETRDMMAQALAPDADLFERLYDDGGWAVYRVNR